MDIEAIEHALRSARAAAVVADARVVRRVIKAHRRIEGIGVYVPHAHSYALRRDALLELLDPGEVGLDRALVPPEIVLVARPQPSELAGKTKPQILQRIWRSTFHGLVHLAIEARIEAAEVTDAEVRARIDRIGQTEFDEIRAILRHDDHLLPPHGDREAYAEFVALYLELWHFAPALLTVTFPGLDRARIDALLRADIDARALLKAAHVEGAEPLPTARRNAETSSPTFSAPAFGGLRGGRPPTVRKAKRLMLVADRAARKGNLVRSALLRAIAARTEVVAERTRARADARRDLEQLGRRLERALTPAKEGIAFDATLVAHNVRAPAGALEWTSALFILAEHAASWRGVRYAAEARLLYDLQRAAIAHERPERAVDLVAWALAAGRVPVVRPLPATRELRIARHVHAAAHRIRQVRLPPAERKLLGRLLRAAAQRADDNVRDALRPKIVDVLDAVGLRPDNLPERVARDKLVEELLDEAVERGRVSLGQLRDAISRNQLKLANLSGVGELFEGDPPLRGDRLLASALDGVYRRGEIYLRLLQKLSSVAFGTSTGRLATMYLILPLGGAFVLLEGVHHILAPVARWIGFGEPHLLSLESLLLTAAVLFALLHSESARAIALRLVSIARAVLRAVFLVAPRWLFARPVVRRIMDSLLVRRVMRRVVVPGLATAAAVFLTPIREHGIVATGAIGFLTFVVTSWAVDSRFAALWEDVLLDWLAPTWRTLSRRVLAGAFRLIVDAFRAAMELLERVIYRIDEMLRFREGQSRVTLVAKAVLGFGWFFVAYAVRLYTTLLVEPEINPVKHFPVVTVAHKLLLPFSPQLLRLIERPLRPLGSLVAGTIAGTTAFLLPSVFGFLVWELKENWKLYRASRARVLPAARIGHHGETMHALLVPGFHSGTIPKVFARLRRSAHRAEGLDAAGIASRANVSHGRFREALHDVEQAITRFVEREFVAIVGQCRRWPFGPLEVVGVELSSNRVRVRIACPSASAAPCEIAFEEQSDLIVASMPQPGFVEALESHSDDALVLFENALAGLYQLAAVDLVREQIEAALAAAYPAERGRPTDVRYDVADEGLVVWPDRGYRSEVVYAIRERRDGPLIAPRLRGEVPAIPPPPLDERRILFNRHRIAYSAWVHAWAVDERKFAATPRLLEGASILPLRGSRRSPLAQVSSV